MRPKEDKQYFFFFFCAFTFCWDASSEQLFQHGMSCNQGLFTEQSPCFVLMTFYQMSYLTMILFLEKSISQIVGLSEDCCHCFCLIFRHQISL